MKSQTACRKIRLFTLSFALASLAASDVRAQESVPAVRSRLRTTVARNRLKALMLALHNYHDAHGSFPAQAIVGADGKPLLSWRVAVLPFLGQRQLYDRFKLDEPWDSPTNKELLREIPKDLKLEDDEANAAAGKTRLVGIAGSEFAFAKGTKGNNMRAFRDFTFQTAMLTVRTADKAIDWTKPEDFEPTKNTPADGLATFEGKFLFALADGSTHEFAENRGRDLFAIYTIAGEERFTLFDQERREEVAQKEREMPPRIVLVQRVKEILLGLANMESTYRIFPTVSGFVPSQGVGLSWRVHLLPMIDEAELYDRFHLEEPWDSEHNRKLVSEMPRVFQHPTKKSLNSQGKTCCLGIAGDGFAIGKTKGVKVRQITDGKANTAMIVIVDPDHAVPWTKPEDWTPRKNDPLQGVADIEDRAMFGYVEGSVRSPLREYADEIWKTFTINGGEVIDTSKLSR